MRLFVKVIEARGLPIVNGNGQRGPYVKVQLGYLKLPLSEVFNAENLSLGTIWYQLRQKSKKSKNRDNEISSNKVESCADSTLSGAEEIKLVDEDKSNGTSFVGVIRQVLGRKSDELLQLNEELCTLESEDTTKKPEICEHLDYNSNVDVAFDELLKAMQSKDQGYEVAKTLSGGILIDQSYMITPCNLNSLLFSPGSEFAKTVAELQGTSDLKIEAWKAENGGSAVKRMLTYMKAASKIIKALRAKEEQVYLKADGKCYSVLASVGVPDAPFG
ncbi:hypothetical protein HPP92_027041 [Vanilla planifolia]|uniref:VASt domain-containing protein n=1 Tax=Vanilla planifolia TaxID=51239 RepID=A0A835PBV8_VANPL|nr:hypothetical protein HPP92_027041 [Vanilla planifolia]